MQRLMITCLFAASAVACDQEATSGTTPLDGDTHSPTDTTTPDTNIPEDSQIGDEIQPPYLVSRFGPSQGIAGTWVTVLTAFDSAGCVEAGTCSVTINGAAAEIVNDLNLLEIIVPEGASTGPLCVTWLDRTECGEDFTVLFAPEIYSISPSETSPNVRDFVLTVFGDGFPPDAQVWVDSQPLDTFVVSTQRLTAVVPYSLTTTLGERAVTVFAPSIARCGVRSEPTLLTVE
jgi:hypothetical protein